MGRCVIVQFFRYGVHVEVLPQPRPCRIGQRLQVSDIDDDAVVYLVIFNKCGLHSFRLRVLFVHFAALVEADNARQKDNNPSPS